MNKIETRKIANELEKLGFKISNDKSDILWFATKDYDGPQELRDKNKNLCRLSSYFSVRFEAGVNKNGVGDNKKPEKALTYSLGFENSGTIRLYRHKNFDSAEHLKFYNYSRNLKLLIEDFKTYLVKIIKFEIRSMGRGENAILSLKHECD